MMNQESMIGKAIVLLRKLKGMSQEKLALETGIDRRYMSDLENGKRKLSLDMLRRISDYFEMSVADLVELSQSPWMFNETTEALAHWLADSGNDHTVILENPNYLMALTGITTKGCLIYSYRRMIMYLMLHEGMEREDAIEFIDYNTVRALDYMGEQAPIVVYDLNI